MGKIVAGVSLLILSLGIASAEDYTASITNVNGTTKITANVTKFDKDAFKNFKKGDFKKGEKGEKKKGEEKTFTVTSDCKVVKSKYNRDEKKLETTAIEDGLKNKMFTEITTDKPLNARITTNDKGEITEIRIGGGKGFGFGGKNKKKKSDTSAQ